MSGRASNAYWVDDGRYFTLYVDGYRRAEADGYFNWATLYDVPQPLRPPTEELFIVDHTVVLIAEIERKLGLGRLPILDRAGAALPDAREQMKERARSFENFDRRPSSDPVGEARENLQSAQDALNEAAIIGALGNQAAEARGLCFKAARLLEQGSNQISREAKAAVDEAEHALEEAQRDFSFHPYLAAAHFYVHRTAVLSELYGQAEAIAIQSAAESGLAQDQIEERAAQRRKSRAFARGF